MKKFKILLIISINSLIAYSYATQKFMIHNSYKNDFKLYTYNESEFKTLKCFSRIPHNEDNPNEDTTYVIKQEETAFFTYNDELDGCNLGSGSSTLFGLSSVEDEHTFAFIGYQPNSIGVYKIEYKFVGDDVSIQTQINYDSQGNEDGIILSVYNYPYSTQ